PVGLRVRSFKGDGGVSPSIISRQYGGPPGTAHGGIVATSAAPGSSPITVATRTARDGSKSSRAVGCSRPAAAASSSSRAPAARRRRTRALPDHARPGARHGSDASQEREDREPFRRGLQGAPQLTPLQNLDVRAVGFGDEHFGKLLKRLDRRLRVLLGDVLEHRAAEPLGVGFSCDGDDLAREDEPTHRDGERQRQNENRLAVPTHPVPPYYFDYGVRCSMNAGRKKEE